MGRGKSHRMVAGAALTAASLVCTPLFAADSPLRPDRIEPPPLKNRIFFFAGGDIARDSHYAWSGIVGAPQGVLQEDGPRFRIMAGTGRYTYRTGAVAGGINGGGVTSGEVMLGFRRMIGATIATIFVGGHVEEQKLAAPDSGHRAQGAGAKVALEVFQR